MTRKTFRGLLTDGGQDKIHLAGDRPEDGYKIVKFEILPRVPGLVSQESIIKIYMAEQTAVDAVVDFTDRNLLGAAFYSDDNNNYPGGSIIIFDNMTFNQDVYVTHSEITGSADCNYYMELEQVKMSGPEQAAVNFRAIIQNTN